MLEGMGSERPQVSAWIVPQNIVVPKNYKTPFCTQTWEGVYFLYIQLHKTSCFRAIAHSIICGILHLPFCLYVIGKSFVKHNHDLEKNCWVNPWFEIVNDNNKHLMVKWLLLKFLFPHFKYGTEVSLWMSFFHLILFNHIFNWSTG